MNLVHQRSQIFPSRSKGIEGLAREATFASCCMAKWVHKLVTSIKTDQPDVNERFRLADEHLGLKPGTSRSLCLLQETYLQPAKQDWANFKLGYLCGVGLQRLVAFAPHLRKYYADPEGTWLQRICVTQWSIEVKISVGSESPAWKDINELTVDQISDLENLIRDPQPVTAQMPDFPHEGTGRWSDEPFGDGDSASFLDMSGAMAPDEMFAL